MNNIRWVLGIEYDGSNYAGWQVQPQVISIQEKVEYAISQVADHPIKTVCAGRTDKGVHAYEQVLHFDSDACRSSFQWRAGINSYLPSDVVVKWVKKAPENFHARFSASARTYHYYIYQHPVPSALRASHILWEPRQLSVSSMHQAAQMLLGEHDFSAFRSQKCQAHSPVKTVYCCEVKQLSDGVIVMTITANSFLYNMVRNIMGVLLSIGRGQQAPETMRSILASKSRQSAGVKVPAHGLYFMHVAYPAWLEADQYIEKYLF